MRYQKMKKFNRDSKSKRHANRRNPRSAAQRVKDTLEALKVPDYLELEEAQGLSIKDDLGEQRDIFLSHHAKMRMSQRSISTDAVALVLQYGRRVHVPHGIIYFFGQKEFKKHFKNHQIASKWDDFKNIHIVVSPDDNTVITTYKNKDITLKADF